MYVTIVIRDLDRYRGIIIIVAQCVGMLLLMLNVFIPELFLLCKHYYYYIVNMLDDSAWGIKGKKLDQLVTMFSDREDSYRRFYDTLGKEKTKYSPRIPTPAEYALLQKNRAIANRQRAEKRERNRQLHRAKVYFEHRFEELRSYTLGQIVMAMPHVVAVSQGQIHA